MHQDTFKLVEMKAIAKSARMGAGKPWFKNEIRLASERPDACRAQVGGSFNELQFRDNLIVKVWNLWKVYLKLRCWNLMKFRLYFAEKLDVREKLRLRRMCCGVSGLAAIGIQ